MPEVRDALLDAGATEVAWADMIFDTVADKSPLPGDVDLVMLACRRTTFEWVLRRSALSTERVEIRDGTVVTGLISDGGALPRVNGLRTAKGDIYADVVLDATGRPSHLIEMLRDIGVTLEETKSGTGIVYLSRFYRMRDASTEPSAMPFTGRDVGYLKYAVFRGDNHTFSVTLAYDPDDDDIRRLRERELFDAAISLMPLAAPWVDPDVSEPISDVHYMGGLINRVRHFVRDEKPIVVGLHAVGDSSVCTNPLYGRGCSFGLVHGALFTDALKEHGDDLTPLALDFDEATRRELWPWYEASVAQDKVNLTIARGEELSDFDTYIRSLVNDGIFPAARVDATVSRAWTRAFNLLSQPYALMSDPEVMRIVLQHYEDRHNREPEPLQGPEREDFLKKIHA